MADVGGAPLLCKVLDAVARSPVADIILVVADKHNAVTEAAGEGRWHVIENLDAEHGLSTSIRAGLEALSKDTLGVLIVLADMPGISPCLIARVLDAARAHPGAIVHPLTEDGAQGHPVFWPADLIPDLMYLEGDKGAKLLLSRYRKRVQTIPAGAWEALADIDNRVALDDFLKSPR